jgi:hypothetical protein
MHGHEEATTMGVAMVVEVMSMVAVASTAMLRVASTVAGRLHQRGKWNLVRIC